MFATGEAAEPSRRAFGDSTNAFFDLLASATVITSASSSKDRLPMSFVKWSRLPRRIAALLGMGALSVAGAQPVAAEPDLGKGPMRVPQQSAKSFGEVRIWSEAGRIYIAEGESDFRDLQLGDPPQARHLKDLLEREGAVPGSSKS